MYQHNLLPSQVISVASLKITPQIQ